MGRFHQAGSGSQINLSLRWSEIHTQIPIHPAKIWIFRRKAKIVKVFFFQQSNFRPEHSRTIFVRQYLQNAEDAEKRLELNSSDRCSKSTSVSYHSEPKEGNYRTEHAQLRKPAWKLSFPTTTGNSLQQRLKIIWAVIRAIRNERIACSENQKVWYHQEISNLRHFSAFWQTLAQSAVFHHKRPCHPVRRLWAGWKRTTSATKKDHVLRGKHCCGQNDGKSADVSGKFGCQSLDFCKKNCYYYAKSHFQEWKNSGPRN